MKNHIKTLLSTSALFSTLFLSSNMAQASGLLVNVQQYYHQLPDSVSDVCLKHDNCPTIEVSYINSTQPWINTLINQNVNQLIAGDAKYQPVSFVDYHVNVPKEVQTTLDNFAKSQIEDMSGSQGLPYSKSVEPAYLGHVGSLELFSIGGYDYFGGAHGMGFVFYSILDSDLKQEIGLDDILIANQKPVLSKLVEAEFDKWIIEQGMTPSEHKAYWKFRLTNNVTFTPEGLSFLHQPYEVGPYAAGMPEFTVPYAKLKGVLKPKYLKLGKQFSE
ncbi:RsiV family protein [Psychrobacter sp. HD31]|uniref:RsiV family protein n=1 Tax=Psychrobacter sp. HD31 TaxID=3112003 RepID=UPI003DA3F83F